MGAESIQLPAYHHAQIDQLVATLPVLPIAPAIRLYTRERERPQASGQPIDSFDLLIGATAIAHNLTMVTNNTRHFQCLPLPVLEDWSQ